MKLKRWAKYLFIVGGAFLGVLYLAWSAVNVHLIMGDKRGILDAISITLWIITFASVVAYFLMRAVEWWIDNEISAEIAEWFDRTFKEPDDE